MDAAREAGSQRLDLKVPYSFLKLIQMRSDSRRITLMCIYESALDSRRSKPRSDDSPKQDLLFYVTAFKFLLEFSG